VVINKCDLYDPQRLNGVQAMVRELNPSAAIVRTQHCALDFDLLAPEAHRLPHATDGQYAPARIRAT